MTHKLGFKSVCSVVGGLVLVLAGCGDDSSTADGGSGSGSSSGGSTEGPPDTSGPPPGDTSATSMGMTGSGSTSTPDPDSSGGTTMAPATSTGGSDTAGTADGGSSTGGPGDEYPPCAGDMSCPPPYDVCYGFLLPDFSVCTAPCADPGDCPQPSTGDAAVVCAGPMGDQCLLDCAGGATCPDGMECQQVGGGMMSFDRCVWPS